MSLARKALAAWGRRNVGMKPMHRMRHAWNPLSLLVAIAVVALAAVGATAPWEPDRRRPRADCRWEIVEIGTADSWRGGLERWPVQTPGPLILLD